MKIRLDVISEEQTARAVPLSKSPSSECLALVRDWHGQLHAEN